MRARAGYFLISMLVLATSGLSLITSAEDKAKVDSEAVTIWSQGVRLAGDIYKPGSIAADQKLPGILLVPGWGGSKANVGKNYAIKDRLPSRYITFPGGHYDMYTGDNLISARKEAVNWFIQYLL